MDRALSLIAKIAAVIVVVSSIVAVASYLALRGSGGSARGTATVTVTVTRPVAAKPESHKIVVYVYSDFMAWGENPRLFQQLVKDFEMETGIKVELRTFKDARSMVLTAIEEYKRGLRTADVVVGVDSLTATEMEKAGMVYCYLAPGADKALARALDPHMCITPVDYGLIALVYDPSRLSPAIVHMLEKGVTLSELPKLAPYMVVEDPTKSSTGLNFLLYTIALANKTGVSWLNLWREMKKNDLLVMGSWSAAYSEFSRHGSRRAIMVSYGTDPAYSAWENLRHGKPMTPSIRAAVLRVGNTTYGWVQVEGAAIVKGGDVADAEKFVDWLESTAVQSLIPSSQWMLPARPGTPLPVYYHYALTEKSVDRLANTLVPQGVVYRSLDKWLAEWLRVMSG